MAIPNGVILMWSGTNASIPAGWSRVTSLDDKYLKGTAVSTNPGTTGGAATHTHTSPTHTHTNDAHTHTISVANGVGGSPAEATGNDGPSAAHNHSSFTSGAVATFTCDSPAATYGSISNNPPYYDVIFITPTVSEALIPTGVIGLSDISAATNYSICNGGGTTPNLVDKFLKGASAGGNAGGTGGSSTNTHTLTHTHTTSHQHSATTSGVQSDLNMNSTVAAGSYSRGSHTHSISLPAPSSNNISTDNVSLVTTETVEPEYTKLIAVQATSSVVPFKGIIAMWLGTLANIPFGWILCDGTRGTINMKSRYLKITGTVGSIGTTGGSNTHTHASQSHGHTITASSHSTSAGHTGVGTANVSGGSISTSATTHAITTDSVSLVLSSSNTTADSSSNEPPYLTVAFIKFTAPTSTFLLNFI